MSTEEADSKELALKRIQLLRQLVEDLTCIVNGKKPTAVELDTFVSLHGYRVSHRPVPCLVGFGTGHPTLRSGPITTSQIFALDPDRRWVRTLSRFYRLHGEAAQNSSGDAQ